MNNVISILSSKSATRLISRLVAKLRETEDTIERACILEQIEQLREIECYENNRVFSDFTEVIKHNKTNANRLKRERKLHNKKVTQDYKLK